MFEANSIKRIRIKSHHLPVPFRGNLNMNGTKWHDYKINFMSECRKKVLRSAVEMSDKSFNLKICLLLAFLRRF